MRKKILFAWLIVMSMVSSWAQVVPPAQPTKSTPPVTELKVTRKKGEMFTPDGKKVDWRLFPFTTKDAEGKIPTPKGGARYRQGKVYIPTALLEKNSLDDPKSEQSAKLKEYMAAEKTANKTIAKKVIRKSNKPRKTDSAKVKVIKPKPVVVTDPTLESKISDLGMKLTQAEKETKAVTAERDKLAGDKNALLGENATLRKQLDDANAKLAEANQKLAKAGLTKVETNPVPTEGAISFLPYGPWEPAWWNLRMEYDPGTRSEEVDWNYARVIGAWIVLAIIAWFLSILIRSGIGRRRQRKQSQVMTTSFVRRINWSLLLPWNWFRKDIPAGRGEYREGSGIGLRGFENPAEPVEGVGEVKRIIVDIPQDPAAEPLDLTANGSTNGAPVDDSNLTTVKPRPRNRKNQQQGKIVDVKPAVS